MIVASLGVSDLIVLKNLFDQIDDLGCLPLVDTAASAEKDG